LTSLGRDFEENHYSGHVCPQIGKYNSETYQANLDGDPLIEIRGSVRDIVKGFAAKHDSGSIRVWGWYDSRYLTEWSVLGAPIIGIHMIKFKSDLSLIVGDVCRPKFFGARKLSVRLKERRELKFYY